MNTELQSIQETTETVEQRQARKLTATDDMCRRLENLEPSMLGNDLKGQPITYSHLTTLLRQGLGMHEQKDNQDFLSLQEDLWTIMIDRRDKCHKDPKDLYYSQTYLGIVGHFVKQKLINGKAQKILDCLYDSNDQSMVKNLKRGIVPTFPEGTAEMFDFYINQL